MAKVSCVQSCGPSLCSVCGPNINTEDVLFSQREANLVYMDKVYSYNKATACPILQQITPGTEWTTELVLESTDNNSCGCGGSCGCGCGSGGRCGCECGSGGSCGCECGTGGSCGCGTGCSCGGGANRPIQVFCCCGGVGGETGGCTLSSDAVFTVTRSYVLVQNLTLGNGALAPGNVTVDGVAVDSLTQAGNRYTATTANVVRETNRKRCADLGLPSKHFFLVAAPGPWQLSATIVLEGTVNTGGKTCCFQAKFSTPAPLSINGASTLAVAKLALPCTVDGVSPTINFSFNGLVYVLNPQITANCVNGNCTLSLTASLAVQPQLSAEVVRRTLFCLDACEGMLPCDGTQAAYELDSVEEDCEWPPAPACCCGTAPSPANDPDVCDTSIVCDFSDDDRSCNCTESETAGAIAPSGYQWNGCNGCSGW